MPETGAEGSMKGCREIRELLSAFVDDSVTAVERDRVGAHLEGCPRCRTALHELRRTVELVRGLDPVEPPPWLEHRIMTRVREDVVSRRSFRQRFFVPLPVKLPLQAMALVVICVTGYYLARTAGPEIDLNSAVQREKPAEAPSSGQGVTSLPPSPPGKAQPAYKAERAPVSELHAGSTASSSSSSSPAGGGARVAEPGMRTFPDNYGAGKGEERPAPGASFQGEKRLPPYPPPVLPAASAPGYPNLMRRPGEYGAAAEQEEETTGIRGMDLSGRYEEKTVQSATEPRRAAKKAKAPWGARERAGAIIYDSSAEVASLKLRLQPADPQKVEAAMTDLFRRAGAVVIDRRNDGTTGYATVRLDTARLSELLRGVAQLGKLENPTSYQDLPGQIVVTIHW